MRRAVVLRRAQDAYIEWPPQLLHQVRNEPVRRHDADSRMFKMTVEIPNTNLRLKPGSFIKTDIVVQEKPAALVISKSIILDRRGAKTVFVVERGIALERRITTGIENIDEAEVLTGLKAGDRVVTEGFETLRANARVKIIE